MGVKSCRKPEISRSVHIEEYLKTKSKCVKYILADYFSLCRRLSVHHRVAKNQYPPEEENAPYFSQKNSIKNCKCLENNCSRLQAVLNNDLFRQMKEIITFEPACPSQGNHPYSCYHIALGKGA